MSIFITPVETAYGQNVKPYDGAFYYFYEVGTTTPKATYSDSSETIAQPHPVVADANGRFAPIYISGDYKAVLKDKNDIQIWEADNLQSGGSGITYKGDFDSSTNSGDYPTGNDQGDLYRVATGFTLNAASGGHILQTYDFIIANKSPATAIDADWNIMRGVVSNTGAKALTPAASVATDCSEATVFTLAIDQNATLANPTNKIIGQQYIWQITQDSVARTLSFGTDFDFKRGNLIDATAASISIIIGTVISSTSIQCEIISDNMTLNGSLTIPGSIIMADGTTIGQAAGPLLTFDDTNNFLEITGCDIGVKVTAPDSEFDVLGIIKGYTGAAYNSTPGATLGLFLQGASSGTMYIDAYDPSGNSILSFGTNASGGAVVEGLKIAADQTITMSKLAGTGQRNVTVDANGVLSLTAAATIAATTFTGDLNGTINTATTATTQAASDDSTKVATTAHVKAQLSTSTPEDIGTATAGSTIVASKSNHVHALGAAHENHSFQAVLSDNVFLAANSTSGDIVWDVENWDPQSMYDVSNGRFTPPFAGKWMLTVGGVIGSALDGLWHMLIYKSGSLYCYLAGESFSLVNLCAMNGSIPVDTSGSDYWTVRVNGVSGTAALLYDDPYESFFSATLIR